MITYVVGDATQPIGEGRKIIAHCCNDAGGWGSGFVVAVSKRWPGPERAYRAWHQKGETFVGTKFELGAVQFALAEPGIEVANIIGQHGYGGPTAPGYPFIRYEALTKGLAQVAELATRYSATVHMPRIGCGLAGGSWDRVEEIINRVMPDVRVFVYDLEVR